VDSAWEQYKLEARKMLENGDESHLSSARFVGRVNVSGKLLARPHSARERNIDLSLARSAHGY